MLKKLTLLMIAGALSACASGGDKGGGGTTVVNVNSVSLTGAPSGGIYPGQTVQLTAQALDASGTVLVGRAITWTSSDEAVATVNASGLVTAVNVGTATITATSEGKSASTSVTVLPAPILTSVSPALLTPGATATITGSNFSTTPSANTVTIDGVTATVTAATATQLTIIVPTTLPCEATHNATISVGTGAVSGTTTAALQTAPQRTMTVGQVLEITDPAQMCTELSGSGSAHYLLSVSNVSRSPTATVAFTVRGVSASAPGAALQSPLATVSPLASLAARVGRTMPSLDAQRLEGMLRQHEAAHARQLRKELAFLEQAAPNLSAAARRPRPSLSTLGLGDHSSAMTSIPTTVGDSTILHWRGLNGSCSSLGTNMKVRTVFVGTQSIVLEDMTNATSGLMNAAYQALGQEFDTLQIKILQNNFGNPLAFDGSLSNTGKVLMVFTHNVNEATVGGGASQLLGFVSSCDFINHSFAPSSNPTLYQGSNENAMFYGFVPTNTNPTGTGSIGDWNYLVKGVMQHEMKHATSFAERFQRGFSAGQTITFEDAWLEEATAQIASELYFRAIYNRAWKADLTYAQSVYCDYHTTDPACAGKPSVMSLHYGWLRSFISTADTATVISTSQGQSFYGGAWLFVRWAIDHYATTEAGFIKPMVQTNTRIGISNLETATGRPFEEMYQEYAMSLMADNYPSVTIANPKVTEPSWNLRDVFAGLFADGKSPSAYPLAMRSVTFGNFSVDVPQVYGGASSYFDLSGTQAAKQLVQVRGALGTAPPSTVRMTLVRVQ